MDRKKGLILLGVGVAALALLAKKFTSLKNLGDLITITPSLDGKPSLKGGILGKLVVPIGVAFANRSDAEATIQIQSVKLRYNGREVGDIQPNEKVVTIKMYATTPLKGLKFEIPIANLLSTGIAKDLFLKPNGPSDVVKGMTVLISVQANGVPINMEKGLSGVSGLGLTAASERVIRPKSEYLHLIPPASSLNRNDFILNRNGSVEDTVHYMIEKVNQTKSDTVRLAQSLKGKTVDETLRNIWNFVYRYIAYEPDSAFTEQIRRPLRTLHDQKGDCDCYSVLVASMLKNLNIRYTFRITAYYNRPYFQHVYVIVPKPGGGYYTVDPVVDRYNYEKPFTNAKDFPG